MTTTDDDNPDAEGAPTAVRPPDLVLVLDAVDAPAVAEFWAAALRYDRRNALGAFEILTAPGDSQSPMLLVQSVGEAKTVKNRMHLDLHVPDMHAEADRLVALGASRLGEGSLGDIAWIRMADPEGNEFDIGST